MRCPAAIGFLFLVTSTTLLAGAPAAADACPVNCRTWFDGCNTCVCSNGQAGACTKMMCDRQETPRCVDPPSAEAPSPQTHTNAEGCAAYARAAVEQYDQLKGLGCNCWNRRWHSNYEIHQAWCLSLPNWNDSRSEFDIRQTDIGWCRNGRRPC